MRREYTLSATQPYFSAELTFTPSTVIILNNTDQPVYLAVGSTLPPSAMFYDKKILPTSAGIPSNVALPNNSYQFAGYLPTPTDTSNNVKVIFQGTADPFSNKIAYPQRGGGVGGNPLTGGGRMRNYKEFRMNSSNQRQVMELPFWADMMFVLNNTDKEIVFQQGGTLTPNGTYNDLALPAVSYTILQPHGGFQYAAFLDNPTSDDCWIIFTYGYADEYMALKQMGFDWDWYLPPLVIPEITWGFDWDVAPSLWCHFFDWSVGEDGFTLYMPGANESYVLGNGYIMDTSITSFGSMEVSLLFPTPQQVIEVIMQWGIQTIGGVGAADIIARAYLAGSQVDTSNQISASWTTGNYNGTLTMLNQAVADELRIDIRTFTRRIVELQTAQVTFFGVPFKSENC